MAKANESELKVYVIYNHDIYTENSRSYKVGWSLFENAAIKNDLTLTVIHSPWSKSLKLLNQNKIDSGFPAFYTKERAKDMSFSIPISLDEISLFKKAGKSILGDYKASSIGVNENSIHTVLAKKLGFGFVYESTTRPELHRMLKAGRIDYILENESLVEYFCMTMSDDKYCLTKVGASLQQEPLYIVYNNRDPAVYDKFNKINKVIYDERESTKTKELFLSSGYSLEQYKLWVSLLNQHVM